MCDGRFCLLLLYDSAFLSVMKYQSQSHGKVNKVVGYFSESCSYPMALVKHVVLNELTHSHLDSWVFLKDQVQRIILKVNQKNIFNSKIKILLGLLITSALSSRIQKVYE